MRGIYSNSSMDPFPESGWGWGSCSSPAPGSSPSALWGRVLHLRGSSFLSLHWRAIHSRDAQDQCLFGLFHPFLCPALLWLEGHGGFHYFTIRIILLGKGGPWVRNYLHFRFQGDRWCFMHLQTWQFLTGCGVRGDLGGLPWGVACSSSIPGAFACFPVRGCGWICKHQMRVCFGFHQPGLGFPMSSYICSVGVRLIYEPDLIWL